MAEQKDIEDPSPVEHFEMTFVQGSQVIIDNLFGLRTLKASGGIITLAVIAEKSIAISPNPDLIPRAENRDISAVARRLTPAKPHLYVGFDQKNAYHLECKKVVGHEATIEISSKKPVSITKVSPSQHLRDALLAARISK